MKKFNKIIMMTLLITSFSGCNKVSVKGAQH
jgi:hypothetical protein